MMKAFSLCIVFLFSLNIVLSNNVLDWTKQGRTLGRIFEIEKISTALSKTLVEIKNSRRVIVGDLWCALNKIHVVTSNISLVNSTAASSISLNAIYIGGAFLTFDKYKSMLQKLCDNVYIKSDGKYVLNIAFVPLSTTKQIFSFNFLQKSIIKSVVRLLNHDNKNNQKKAISIENTWMMGHSAGAFYGLELAAKYMKGCISFQGIRETKYHVTKKPFLYLSSELDGFLPVSLFANLFETDTFSDKNSISKLLNYLSPHHTIIIAFGINHMQTAHGFVTKQASMTHRNDFPSNISLSQAHDTITDIVSDYLLAYELSNQTYIDKIIKYKKDTYEYLKPIIASLKPQCDVDLVKEWQEFIFRSLPTTTSKNLKKIDQEVEECPSAISFTLSKPYCDYNVLTKTALVSSTFYRMNALEQLLSYTGNSRSLQKDCSHIGGILSVKSTAASKLYYLSVGKYLNSHLSFPSFVRASAAVFNQRTVDKALSMVPKEVKEQYLKYGRKLYFTDDFKIESAPKWLSTPLQIFGSEHVTTECGGKLNYKYTRISCPISILDMSEETSLFPPRFTGGHYVKLISLSFALEWIYVLSKR